MRWKTPSGWHALRFLQEFQAIQGRFEVTSRKGKALPLREGFLRSLHLMTGVARRQRKLIFIGNGGSAAISSHQAVDYWKNGGLEAIAFNDSSLLTCISNDCGYEKVFAVPIQQFAKPSDVVLAISSSGRSRNILNAVRAARRKGCHVITFSGFSPLNPLRQRGEVNFFVPSTAYGIVEISHLALIHAMLREVIFINPRAAKKRY